MGTFFAGVERVDDTRDHLAPLTRTVLQTTYVSFSAARDPCTVSVIVSWITKVHYTEHDLE